MSIKPFFFSSLSGPRTWRAKEQQHHRGFYTNLNKDAIKEGPEAAKSRPSVSEITLGVVLLNTCKFVGGFW